MKARLSKTTSHSHSTSSPLNSSAESSSFRERENSEEEMEAPKTCPQVQDDFCANCLEDGKNMPAVGLCTNCRELMCRFLVLASAMSVLF